MGLPRFRYRVSAFYHSQSSFAEGYHMRAYVLIALNRREDAIEAQQQSNDVVRLHEVQSGKRNRRLMTKERVFGFSFRCRSSHRAMYSSQERGAKPTSSNYAGLRVKPLDDFIELA